jgi:uncharacterized protein (TIGR02646 family)
VIHRSWVPPNFRCKVLDLQQDKLVLLMHAESEAALRELLVSRGYEVIAIEEYNFEEWVGRARTETGKAVVTCGGESYSFRNEIWSELKQYLFELFDGKCAYCEAGVLHVASGDVEHYRPKRKVSECPSHPGYYWLAYEVTNLFPCCERCNRQRGKMNHFPVRNEVWARRREELPGEHPLLLNPYDFEPREHLRFLPVTGNPVTPRIALSIVQGVTEEGRKSVEVYKLNRLDLATDRARAQKQIRQALMTAFFSSNARAIWQRLFSGQEEYSSAALAEAEALLAELQGDYEKERTPLGPNKSPRGRMDAAASAGAADLGGTS